MWWGRGRIAGIFLTPRQPSGIRSGFCKAPERPECASVTRHRPGVSRRRHNEANPAVKYPRCSPRGAGIGRGLSRADGITGEVRWAGSVEGTESGRPTCAGPSRPSGQAMPDGREVRRTRTGRGPCGTQQRWRRSKNVATTPTTHPVGVAAWRPIEIRFQDKARIGLWPAVPVRRRVRSDFRTTIDRPIRHSGRNDGGATKNDGRSVVFD